ncbi:UDP-N-acetylmuramoylalanyl-D-glutamyl-2,6- diaminopimelate--D-alanyl-D-alanine ligase [Streptococcus sp. DD10]|uniref:UDP-N-acetylmuramoyl-tripeptide--D-alanyl-D- alanine ligase n=1 Tax=Streptococcus sp. DD10 TaxID=1777878 RepID=UPI00079C50C2|nr:UDP-N-acetylmuramoyl-tripeptide--D-alanyl-D-alanine ligase [Streptococcus sp. DD10]KXT76763.1 UDP-N-acetylmuramoylalanyl-D-glutamyl-2,6- diaminopimelate--D-alanyl-D-alanine ligase [Streptococcus sp. DD10]
MNLTLHEIARVVGAKNDITQFSDCPIEHIEFDSRLIGAGDLFLPLKGERDGHDFIELAFQNKAVATFSEIKLSGYPYIWVEDTLLAFQTLASYYLDKTKVEVLAVTGSNGKTTTKDMLAQLLSTTFLTYKTQGNYNNEIGLPYTILHMPEGTQKLVLEMGQDHLGDIHLLSTLAKPKSAIVTIVAEAHLEFFKNRAEIAKGKMQIVDGMEKGALLLLPTDTLLDKYISEKQEVVRFGPKGDIDVTSLEERKDSITFTVNFASGEFTLPVTGKYNATNAMVAAYLALKEGVTEDKIRKSFSQLKLTRNRTEWKKASNGADILSDVYNANPTAMKLILETFSTIPNNPSGRKIVVLADMKELGKDSKALHASMLTSLNPDILSHVFLYGEDMEALFNYAKEIFPPERVLYFKKTAEVDQFDNLTKVVVRELQKNDQILLKGSNSMNLSKLVDILEKA